MLLARRLVRRVQALRPLSGGPGGPGVPATEGQDRDVRHINVEQAQTLGDLVTAQGLPPSLVALGAAFVDRRRERDPLAPLAPGAYVRLHGNPTRYPVAGMPDDAWRATVVASDRDWIVVNKPRWLPTVPVVSNYTEVLTTQLERVLGERLFVTARLDVPTAGLVLLARNSAFQQWFNEQLKERRVTKLYDALVDAPPDALPEEGAVIEHWQEPRKHGRHHFAPAAGAGEGWKQCRMRLVSREWDAAREATRVRLELMTGRTHQIRGQMAELGAPVLQDPLYGRSGSARAVPSMALHSMVLEFADFLGERVRVELEEPWWV